MKRVLMVSPHFPPDTSAGTHRVRLVAPYLPELGWEPTVVTVDPRDYESRLDEDLANMLPRTVRTIRVRAWPARWTRRLGVGDLGLRAFRGLYAGCQQLLREAPVDVLFVTIYPTYPALLAPLLKRRTNIPFVLDYQDPWVGSWGRTAGGGVNGAPDLKSRISRALAERLEPIAVRAADALTAVSDGTLEIVRERIPSARKLPTATLPIGGDPHDFEYLREHPRARTLLDLSEDAFHLCYVGTILPLGLETLRAFLKAAALLKERCPDKFRRLRVHFVGTSNQTSASAAPRVIPEAERLGIASVVRELPSRIDYLDALDTLVRADAILLMGSTEVHYTASKLYPALLAKRPLLAVYHERSSVVPIARKALAPPAGRVVTYDEVERAESCVEEIYDNLKALIESPAYDEGALNLDVLEEYSAPELARRLADVFNVVTEARRP